LVEDILGDVILFKDAVSSIDCSRFANELGRI
jgi:hypothetical protein